MAGFPVAMKVVGPVHKSDVGGVVLGVADEDTLKKEFNRMMDIPETVGILVQPMISGTEVFIGAKREGGFGALVMCGLGGIFVEAIKDVSTGLAPFSTEYANGMIKKLRGYGIIKGLRGKEGVNEHIFAEMVSRVSTLCHCFPQIKEMDINPLLGNSVNLIAVDARIRIDKGYEK